MKVFSLLFLIIALVGCSNGELHQMMMDGCTPEVIDKRKCREGEKCFFPYDDGTINIQFRCQ